MQQPHIHISIRCTGTIMHVMYAVIALHFGQFALVHGKSSLAEIRKPIDPATFIGTFLYITYRCHGQIIVITRLLKSGAE